jgi:hypothetical protein
MALTFKSSTPQQREIVERAADGSKRVCRAVQSDHNPRMWRLSLEHPSGSRWTGTAHGNASEATLWMNQLMMDHENDFKQEAARGHKPASQMLRDSNVVVDAFGTDVAAPIRSQWSK